VDMVISKCVAQGWREPLKWMLPDGRLASELYESKRVQVNSPKVVREPKRRNLCGNLAIEYGIERRIVVHLELAVDFEAACAAQDLAPELVETVGEIGALFG
jgi:hypothetical protein